MSRKVILSAAAAVAVIAAVAVVALLHLHYHSGPVVLPYRSGPEHARLLLHAVARLHYHT
jgi:hypothetical protein